MLKINDNELHIKSSTIDFKIENNELIAVINIVTYIGLYKELIQDVRVNISFNVGVYNLHEMVGKVYASEIISSTINDEALSNLKVQFLDIHKEKFMIRITADNLSLDYPFDMMWVYGDYNKNVEDNLKYISNYLSLDEVNPLPFYDTKEETLKFMIER